MTPDPHLSKYPQQTHLLPPERQTSSQRILHNATGWTKRGLKNAIENSRFFQNNSNAPSLSASLPASLFDTIPPFYCSTNSDDSNHHCTLQPSEPQGMNTCKKKTMVSFDCSLAQELGHSLGAGVVSVRFLTKIEASRPLTAMVSSHHSSC